MFSKLCKLWKPSLLRDLWLKLWKTAWSPSECRACSPDLKVSLLTSHSRAVKWIPSSQIPVSFFYNFIHTCLAKDKGRKRPSHSLKQGIDSVRAGNAFLVLGRSVPGEVASEHSECERYHVLRVIAGQSDATNSFWLLPALCGLIFICSSLPGSSWWHLKQLLRWNVNYNALCAPDYMNWVMVPKKKVLLQLECKF